MIPWSNDRRYDIIDALHELLYNILVHGEENTKDDSKVKEHLGNFIQITNPYPQYNENDVIFNKNQFIQDIKDGRYDLDHYGLKGEALADYVSSFSDGKIITLSGDNSFVYTYPNRLLMQKSCDEDECLAVNQIHVIVRRLRDNINTNRAVATIYNPFLDANECLQWLQITIRGNKMRLHCIFRSNDIFGAWYSNMLFLTYIALDILEYVNSFPDGDFVKFEGIDYHCSSAHVYDVNLDSALELFKETGIQKS